MSFSGRLASELQGRRVATLWRPLVLVVIAYGVFAVVTARLPWKLPRLCPFYMLTARDCPLCGLTRGLGLVSQGRPGEAFKRHGRSLVVAALGVAWLAAHASRREFGTLPEGGMAWQLKSRS